MNATAQHTPATRREIILAHMHDDVRTFERLFAEAVAEGHGTQADFEDAMQRLHHLTGQWFELLSTKTDADFEDTIQAFAEAEEPACGDGRWTVYRLAVRAWHAAEEIENGRLN